MVATCTRQRKPRSKPERHVRVFAEHKGERLLQLTVGQEVFLYHLTGLPSDFGRAFQLEKFACDGGEIYHVNLNGQHSTCECKGFLRWGMGKEGQGCKHIAALQVLVNRGRI